jgi:hypothetical protein
VKDTISGISPDSRSEIAIVVSRYVCAEFVHPLVMLELMMEAVFQFCDQLGEDCLKEFTASRCTVINPRPTVFNGGAVCKPLPSKRIYLLC